MDRQRSNTSFLQCSGNETTLNECSVQHLSETACYYVLVQCGEGETPSDEGSNSSVVLPGDKEGSNTTTGDTDIGGSGNGSSSDVDSGDDDDGDGDDGDGDDSDDGDGGDDDDGDDGDGDDGDSDDGDGDSDDGGGDGGSRSEGDDGDDGTSKNDTSSDIDSGSNNNRTDTEEIPTLEGVAGMLSIEIFSGVAVAVLLVLILIAMGAIFLLYMKRKNKHIFPTQYIDSEKRQTKGEKHLDNPTYNSSLKYPPSSQPSEADEHNLVNPLYNMNSEPDNKPEYAELEGPADYAVPIDLHVPHCPVPTNSTADEIPDSHDYDYADIPGSKAV